MSEQDIYSLMVMAQDQQEAAKAALKKLEERQAELDGIVAKACSAVEAMNNAGTASAALIEKATKNAVEKGVQSALERISEQTKSTLADAINPAVKALHGVTARAVEAEESIRDTASALSWKWASVCIVAACALLLTVWSLAWMLTPGYGEIADLRANVAALEAKGGKVQLSTCGPKGRLCARVNAKDAAVMWGPPDKENEKWIILNGY